MVIFLILLNYLSNKVIKWFQPVNMGNWTTADVAPFAEDWQSCGDVLLFNWCLWQRWAMNFELPPTTECVEMYVMEGKSSFCNCRSCYLERNLRKIRFKGDNIDLVVGIGGLENETLLVTASNCMFKRR